MQLNTYLCVKRTTERQLVQVYFLVLGRRTRQFPLVSKGCESSEKWDLWLGMSSRSQLLFHFTHTESQGSAGLPVHATEHQGPLAGMHTPTAAVVRLAQRRSIENTGERQYVLTVPNNQQPTSVVAMQISDKNKQKHFVAHTGHVMNQRNFIHTNGQYDLPCCKTPSLSESKIKQTEKEMLLQVEQI